MTDGTTVEDQWTDMGVELDEAELACQQLYGIQAIDTPASEFPTPSNPNSSPEPGSDTREIEEVIEQINKMVSSPAVPITGAIAGTLLAALLAALRGGVPAPVRNLPPVRTPAPGPGQVNAKGQVYSPVSKSWVSPQMYDYQKSWSEKGWRWNPRTGRFEGQHGAVNEKGQVMDEELGWVDQKTFRQNEQMRGEGMVYDRNLGWQTPEDLNRFESEREGIRQRGREFSAEKNAQIQRELKEAQAQRERAFQEKMRQIERAEEIKADQAMYQKRAQRYIDRDKQLENYAEIAKWVERGADVAVAVCARMTGPVGKGIAAAYETVKEVAVAADDIAHADDRMAKAEELKDEKIKDKYKEKAWEKGGEKAAEYFPRVAKALEKVDRAIKKMILKKTGKPGLIVYDELKKKAVELAQEEAEEKIQEQAEDLGLGKAEEFVKKVIDPQLFTGT